MRSAAPPKMNHIASRAAASSPLMKSISGSFLFTTGSYSLPIINSGCPAASFFIVRFSVLGRVVRYFCNFAAVRRRTAVFLDVFHSVRNVSENGTAP